MNSIARRIAAGAALVAAPALIALGTATAGHTETTTHRQRPVGERPGFPQGLPDPGPVDTR